MTQTEWQIVPKQATEAMQDALNSYAGCAGYVPEGYVAMLAAAPEPPHLSITKEEAATFQDWRGMDGACAFHLIERHANGWGDTKRMMEAWLAANAAPSNA